MQLHRAYLVTLCVLIDQIAVCGYSYSIYTSVNVIGYKFDLLFQPAFTSMMKV